MEMVLAASEAGMLPVPLRNKLYASLNRALDRPGVPAAVLARWSADQQLQPALV